MVNNIKEEKADYSALPFHSCSALVYELILCYNSHHKDRKER